MSAPKNITIEIDLMRNLVEGKGVDKNETFPSRINDFITALLVFQEPNCCCDIVKCCLVVSGCCCCSCDCFPVNFFRRILHMHSGKYYKLQSILQSVKSEFMNVTLNEHGEATKIVLKSTKFIKGVSSYGVPYDKFECSLRADFRIKTLDDFKHYDRSETQTSVDRKEFSDHVVITTTTRSDAQAIMNNACDNILYTQMYGTNWKTNMPASQLAKYLERIRPPTGWEAVDEVLKGVLSSFNDDIVVAGASGSGLPDLMKVFPSP